MFGISKNISHFSLCGVQLHSVQFSLSLRLTSCHQSGTQKVKSEPNYWYAFSINLNEDDIRSYLSDLGIKQAKMRRNQEIKIDIYIREKD